MNKYIKKLIDALNKKFKQELERQKKFFRKPEVLIALGISSLILLDKILKDKKTKEETKAFFQKDTASKIIISYTQQELNDDSLNDILLKCLYGSEVVIPEIQNATIPEDFISYADKNNDIDSKVDSKKFKSLLGNIKYTTELFLTFTFLINHIVHQSKDLLTKTDYPSKYRLKYIQRLTRNVYGLIKTNLEVMKIDKNQEFFALKEGAKKTVNETQDAIKDKYEKILSSLKQIDNILIAVGIATAIYLFNRKKLQQKSTETLQVISRDIICTGVPESFDVSINKIQFEINLNCPVITDDVIVPHIPIEEKLKDISCEIVENEEIIEDINEKPDLVTHAVIRNSTQKMLNSVVSKDAYLTPQLPIANLSGQVVYSPVNGYIEQLNPNEIVLREISDPNENFLTTQISLLNEKYEKLNNIKSFLKYYYVGTLYPSMLAIAIVDDTSTHNTQSGIEKIWKGIKEEYFRFDEVYNKEIKKITGKNNVEKHAKNETLNQIKEEVEKQEEIYYKHLNLLRDVAINESKKTKAKTNEYELFEFYLLDLGAAFNQLDYPNDLELIFRDQINEFIRRRMFVDGYKKSKLENKINDLIKDIEKGISVGNWFHKAMDIYRPAKKLSDVKSWLTGLANKNKKLEGIEKTQAVNRVMFLIEFYLNIDQISKKYNILEKETTSKKETVKEGNWIFSFTQDLWKQYKTLPKEIDEIQKVIDSLSLFQTYSIINWNGYQARLYTISDKPKCESVETDPYLNPKSEYGYGDIQYWLKYCAFATLASVTNPALGWSTGIIFPAPILFPVVYIPVKPIYTNYGFIVTGISICGMYIFPWILMANLSPKYVVPIGDPTVMLKREMDALKRSISDQSMKLKKDRIKPLIDKTKQDIKSIKDEIKMLKQQLAKNKESKPKKIVIQENTGYVISDIKNGVQQNLNYLNEYVEWNKRNAELTEAIATLKVKLWKQQIIVKTLQKIHDDGKSVKGVSPITDAIDESQKLIDKQVDKLIAIVDNADKIISVLPTALHPETANFGITIKNPKPVIKIAENLDDMVNIPVLDKITQKFELKNGYMMSTNYPETLVNTVINNKSYKQALSSAMSSIVIKDAFPHYSLLKPTNIPWVTFLYRDFVAQGARTYGWPGGLPLPI